MIFMLIYMSNKEYTILDKHNIYIIKYIYNIYLHNILVVRVLFYN